VTDDDKKFVEDAEAMGRPKEQRLCRIIRELEAGIAEWENGVLAYKCFECGSAITPIANINLRSRIKELEAEHAKLEASLLAIKEEVENAPWVYAWKDQDNWRRPLDETDCDFDWRAKLVQKEKLGK